MKSRLRRLLLVLAFVLPAFVHAQVSMVRLHTTQGVLDMKMLDGAPVTVDNFLAYVRGGDYASSMIHRSAWAGTSPFVIQGGGYRWQAGAGITAVPSRGAIVNEFSSQRSNQIGTVAMAKLDGLPNSATNQWFVNLGNNAFLDTQNGGFTVFARVTGPGMAVASRIVSLQRVNVGAPFTEMPVQNWQQGTNINRDNVVLVTEARELDTSSDAHRIFNYLEAQFADYLVPQKGTRGTWNGYAFSYYVTSNVYVGVKDGEVHYLMPSYSNDIQSLGAESYWFGMAQAAGY